MLATFFLIWTLVTSFFGQNFKWLTDHIDSFEAFLVYEALGLVLPDRRSRRSTSGGGGAIGW